jgi:uncharacterized protein YijF (DUF1287 family)
MPQLSRRTVVGMLVVAPMVGGAGAAAASAGGDGERLAAAARNQVGVTKGDVLRSTGVCADVLVRAARDAWRADLQQRVHEDMTRAFDAYPSRRAWGLKGPDSNIDHRRVLNLETYLVRQHALLARAPGKAAGDSFEDPLLPGDILTWRVWGGRPHIGVVCAGPDHPRVVHNIGGGAKEEPLWMFKLHKAVAHYRWRA